MPGTFVGPRRALLGGGAVFDPRTIAGLKVWLKADVGLTLSTTSYAGTGTVTQVGTAITGVGTAFLSEVVIGDTLTGTLISGKVTAIASNTGLTVDASNSGAGSAFTINPTAGVSDRVTTWTDQSGQGNSPTQATAALKPSREAGAKNGLPAVKSNGVSNLLQSSAFGVELAQPYTVFLVYKFLLTNNTRILVDGLADPKRFYFGIEPNSGQKESIYLGNQSIPIRLADTNWHIYRVVAAGASSVYQFDGGAETVLGGLPGTANLGGLTLFRAVLTNYAAGAIGELVIFGGDLSATNDAAVLAYLNQRWAVY